MGTAPVTDDASPGGSDADVPGVGQTDDSEPSQSGDDAAAQDDDGTDVGGAGTDDSAADDSAADDSGVDDSSTDDGTPDDDTSEPDSLPSLIGNVQFSVPSQTFQGELSVELTSATAGAQIYYTTDGTLPSSTSTAYDGSALLLTETTQLRALAYVDGSVAGLDSTAIYVRRTFDYSSDIPIVVMEGYAGGKPEDKNVFVDLAFMTFEPADGTAALSNLPTLATRAGYHIRGQSSASFEKAPYRVELWDNANEDADYPMLGMPAEADWAMIGPYTDKTLIRNAFVYSLSREMGLEAMDLRFAEVFINQDGGPLEESDYQGVYAVTQTIKNQKTRVDLAQLEPSVTGEPAITGGFIFKFDQAAVDEDETVIECTGSEPLMSGSFGGGFGGGGADPDAMGGTCWSDLELVDPDPISEEQLAYIEGYLQLFHDALHEEPVGDYAQYIDMRSFVDHFIINEITRDVDAYIRSHYYHKDRESPLKAGPIWDYNFSLGNFATELEGWQWEDGRAGTNDWFRILGPDANFLAEVRVRWTELRQTLLSNEAIAERIATVSAPLVNAGPRDLERWPVGESGFFGGGFGGGGFGGGDDAEDEEPAEPAVPEDWQGQVDAMRDWTLERVAWLDTQLLQ